MQHGALIEGGVLCSDLRVLRCHIGVTVIISINEADLGVDISNPSIDRAIDDLYRGVDRSQACIQCAVFHNHVGADGYNTRIEGAIFNYDFFRIDNADACVKHKLIPSDGPTGTANKNGTVDGGLHPIGAAR